MQDLRNLFHQSGVRVTSEWLDINLQADFTDEQFNTEAYVDLINIETADVFILYNPLSNQGMGSGGRHVEMGYALARNKHIILVGEKKENVFQYIKEIIFLEYPGDGSMRMLCKLLIALLKGIEDAELREGPGSVQRAIDDCR